MLHQCLSMTPIRLHLTDLWDCLHITRTSNTPPDGPQCRSRPAWLLIQIRSACILKDVGTRSRNLLPCLSTALAAAKAGALQILQRLLDRLGMGMVPYLNLVVVPLMSLTSDPLLDVRDAATSAFAAAVALLPLAQVRILFSGGEAGGTLKYESPRPAAMQRVTAWLSFRCCTQSHVAHCAWPGFELLMWASCRALHPQLAWTNSRTLLGTRTQPSYLSCWTTQRCRVPDVLSAMAAHGQMTSNQKKSSSSFEMMSKMLGMLNCLFCQACMRQHISLQCVQVCHLDMMQHAMRSVVLLGG